MTADRRNYAGIKRLKCFTSPGIMKNFMSSPDIISRISRGIKGTTFQKYRHLESQTVVGYLSREYQRRQERYSRLSDRELKTPRDPQRGKPRGGERKETQRRPSCALIRSSVISGAPSFSKVILSPTSNSHLSFKQFAPRLNLSTASAARRYTAAAAVLACIRKGGRPRRGGEGLQDCRKDGYGAG